MLPNSGVCHVKTVDPIKHLQHGPCVLLPVQAIPNAIEPAYWAAVSETGLPYSWKVTVWFESVQGLQDFNRILSRPLGKLPARYSYRYSFCGVFLMPKHIIHVLPVLIVDIVCM